MWVTFHTKNIGATLAALLLISISITLISKLNGTSPSSNLWGSPFLTSLHCENCPFILIRLFPADLFFLWVHHMGTLCLWWCCSVFGPLRIRLQYFPHQHTSTETCLKTVAVKHLYFGIQKAKTVHWGVGGPPVNMTWGHSQGHCHTHPSAPFLPAFLRA